MGAWRAPLSEMSGEQGPLGWLCRWEDLEMKSKPGFQGHHRIDHIGHRRPMQQQDCLLPLAT